MKGSENSDHISSAIHDIVPYEGHNESDDEPSGFTHDSSTVTLLIMLIYLIRHQYQHMDTYNSISSSSTITMDDSNSEYDDKHSVSELSR
jgi:hypothetical protein